MSHNIDTSNNRDNIAFLGSRNDVWHRLGQEMQPGMSIDQWAKAAGLDWEAIKVPAIPDLSSPRFDHIDPRSRMLPVPERNFLARSDTAHVLGYCSDRYQPVQPRDVLEWFNRYIAVDDRFQLDVAGSLKHGEVIWATALYRDPMTVAGDRHLARLLMTTTFDGTGSTINKATVTRVVCNNTLDAALADNKALVRTRHNTRFDPARVSQELSRIVQGFEAYKKMGDAMAGVEYSKEQVSLLFKQLLDIPFDAKSEDISTRKLNQFTGLSNCYRATVAEGTPAGTVWTALNAVTRYADHEKTVRGNGITAEEKQFTSAQFGSGASMKAEALGILMPFIGPRQRELVPVAR